MNMTSIDTRNNTNNSDFKTEVLGRERAGKFKILRYYGINLIH